MYFDNVYVDNVYFEDGQYFICVLMIEIVTSLRSKLDISFEIAVCVCVTGFIAVLIEIVTGFVCCKF